MPIHAGVAKMQYFLPFLLNLCSSDPTFQQMKKLLNDPRIVGQKNVPVFLTFQSTLGSQVEGSLPRHGPSSVSNIMGSWIYTAWKYLLYFQVQQIVLLKYNLLYFRLVNVTSQRRAAGHGSLPHGNSPVARALLKETSCISLFISGMWRCRKGLAVFSPSVLIRTFRMQMTETLMKCKQSRKWVGSCKWEVQELQTCCIQVFNWCH